MTIESIIGYLQSPATLIVATTALVAIVRRFVPRIDGPALTCACAAVCGAVLAGLQAAVPYLVAFVVAHPVIGTALAGALAGAGAFGLHDLAAGLLSKAASVTIDARGDGAAKP